MIFVLSGCAAALVPYTDDPKQKVANAKWLFEEKHRALPAEKLLNEAINAFKKNNDEEALAETYRVYGIFLSSYAVDRWKDKYIEKGFIEPDVTYKNRHDKSIEYLEKSKKYYLKHKQYASLTNVYLRMGFTFSLANQTTKACSMFSKSIGANEIFMNENPDAKIVLDGYESYKEYVADKKVIAGCK